MASKRITVAFNQAELQRLDDLAKQLGKSKSEIACEAVRQYYERRFGGNPDDQPAALQAPPSFPN